MMRISFVSAAALLLTACATSTATPGPTVTTTGASTIAVTPSLTTPAQTSTPAATAPGVTDDPFIQRGITLEAPVCDGSFTPQQTEGPYYTAGSPEQNILHESGMEGIRLIVVGYVLGADCQPIPGAWLDFWQADANGVYDNQGYTLRGHQFTDEQGRYLLETVMPGEYSVRTAHIHVKVQAPGGQILTSQLYFPDSLSNTSDSIFTPATQVVMEDRGDHQRAYYNFVLNAE